MHDTNLCLEIDRSSLARSRVRTAALPALAAGQVRLRIERFAVTANTVTYAVTGDLLGYWNFFPSGDPGWGRVPAMGWAEVVSSSHPGIATGGRYYGWFPMCRYVDLTVTPTADGLRDDGPHRAGHAPVYRACVRTDRDPYHQAGADSEDRHALLRGLFITGFLAEDYFADHDYFGATRVLVLSASSKTAIGFAHCADARPGIEVIGVTSPANHAFSHELGCYDEVVGYADLEAVPAASPIVVIDMAGNGPVLARVHAHFGEHLRHSMVIGRSHHDTAPRAESLPGPRPAFFFAPTQVQKRLQDWGRAGYEERIAHALRAFVAASPAWLALRHAYGAEAAAATWREMHAGRVPPGEGHVVSLWDGPAGPAG
jgi:hypothetical protein